MNVAVTAKRVLRAWEKCQILYLTSNPSYQLQPSIASDGRDMKFYNVKSVGKQRRI